MRNLTLAILCFILLTGCPRKVDPEFLRVSSEQLKFKGKGGELRVEVKSSSAWEAAAVWADQEEWLAFSPEKGEKGTTVVTVEALPNEVFSGRSVRIGFSSENGITKTLNITQSAREPDPLNVEPLSLDYTAANTTDYLAVETTLPSWQIEVVGGPDWCSAQKDGSKKAKISAKTNFGEEREATVRITAGTYKAEVVLTQQPLDGGEHYGDGQVVQLQQSTAGNGIDIILLGDGYTLGEMGRHGDGKYETDMRAAADHFFSVYPYSAYRDHFNVYMVTAISEEAGMSSVTPPVNIDTKFGTRWSGGNSTSIVCSEADVRDYVSAVTDMTGKRTQDMTVIMPINSAVYAGTCMMWTDGFSVAMIPVGTKFGKVVVHEAGGHGFAKLIDEYIYNESVIPPNLKNEVMAYKPFGFYINADFSDNILETTWSGFANHPKYPMVGIYAGAYMYRMGIWRPEQNSCMNDNVLYFNAPSRWAQMKRMYELAGIPYSFDQFLEEDEIPPYPAAAKLAISYAEPFIPTGPPIVFTTPSGN